MKHLVHSVVAMLTAGLALLLLTGIVRSGPSTDRVERKPVLAAINLAPARQTIGQQTEQSAFQSTSIYSLTRIVTITVGTSAVPLIPSLDSRWQIDLFSQEVFGSTSIRLPSDASAISVTLINGEYSIDYAGPTIYITDSQGLYYEYRTNQQALRFGNQILISQTFRYNRPLHYVGTLTYTEPYTYLGYSGYAPTQTGVRQLHWDVGFPEEGQTHQFETATWLEDPRIIRPDLEIVTATLLSRLNHVYVTAGIHNNGPMTAGAPAYLNLYDRIAPSVPPTGPLDLAGGWCSLTPVSWCGGAGNPLPIVPPGQTVIFTTVHDLSPIDGLHDIYLFVDALGGSKGLNAESAENNNWYLVDSVMRWDAFVFLPLIRR